MLCNTNTITARLAPGADLAASFDNGELAFSIDGVTIIDRIFVDKEEGDLIAAQWKVLASTFSITEKTDGKKLCNALRKLAVSENSPLVNQIIALEHSLAELEDEIARQELEMNSLIFDLYGLTEAEIEVVKEG